MAKQDLPTKPIVVPTIKEQPSSGAFKGFLLAAYRSITNNARSLKITRTLLIFYLLLLVIIPPIFIIIAFFISPSQAARFFNFQVRTPLSLSENPDSQVLAASTSSQNNALVAYVSAALEPQAEAAIKTLRVVAPVTVDNICLPGECETSQITQTTTPTSDDPVIVPDVADVVEIVGPQGPAGTVGALTTGAGLIGSLTDAGLELDLDSAVPTSIVDDTNITGNIDSNTLTLGWAGSLSPDRGGTGLSGTPTNGELLIGNGSDYTISGLTAGPNISITNGAGSITVAAPLSSTGGLTNNSGISLSTDCSNGQVLAWDSATSSWACATIGISGVSSLNSLSGALNVSGGGINTASVLGSTITITGTIPSLDPTYFTSPNISQWINDSNFISDGNTNWDNNYGFITASSGDTFSNKTIAAGSNTISGLTNYNLSGTAGITNANLANSGLTVTAGNGLSGGGSFSLGGSTSLALNLTTSGATGSTSSNSGLEVSASGLTMLHGCGDGELLKWTDAGGWACAVDSLSGSLALDTIAAASGVNSINNGNNAQVWNWNLTTAAKTAFTFGEDTASTNGAGSQYILGLSTLVGSTAAPLKVSAGGNTIIDTTSTGGLTFGNTTANTPITLQSGTGTINIGADATAKTINFGNTVEDTAININSGTGNVNFTVGSTSSSGKVQVGNSATTTPDVLVLDNGTADPNGASATNGAMYYNTSTSKFRCYENGAWENCISTANTSSDLQHAASYDTSQAFNNVSSSQVTLGTVSVTPSTANGDVYVTGFAEVRSSSNTNQAFHLVIETTNNCTGTIVGNASATYTITTNTSSTTHLGNIRVSGIAVDVGASAQPYSLCASTATGDTDVLNWGIEALVIDTGADLAEIYTTNDASIEEGDVVSLDPSLKTGIRKSQVSYDQTALGVISTQPGLLIGGVGKEGVNALPVALSGRVPVKVSTENGAINAGDYLTTSEIPGVAMKATRVGAIIGIAITSFDGEGIGQVLVFVKNGSSLGNSKNENPEDNISKEEDLVINSAVIDYITEIVLNLFEKTVEFFDAVIFRSDVIFQGRPMFNEDTAGHACIKAGDNEIEIIFEKEYITNPVVTVSVNLEDSVKAEELPKYAIYDLSTKGFKVKLSDITTFDLNFSWIALSVTDDKNSSNSSISDLSPDTISETETQPEIVIPETVPISSQETTPSPTVTDVSSDEGEPESSTTVGQPEILDN